MLRMSLLVVMSLQVQVQLSQWTVLPLKSEALLVLDSDYFSFYSLSETVSEVLTFLLSQ